MTRSSHPNQVSMKGKDSKPTTSAGKTGSELEVQGREQNYLVDIVVVRTIFAITLTLAAYYIKPFGIKAVYTIILGLGSALGIIYFEHRLKRATLKRLIGAAVGSIMGIIGASLISDLLTDTAFDVKFIVLHQALHSVSDDVCRSGCWREQGRFPESVRAGRNFRRRASAEEGLQDSGYQRHHRRPHRRYLRNRFSGRDSGDSPFRAARTPAGRRLRGFAEAQSRPPRSGHSADESRRWPGITVQFVENDYPQVREVDMKLIELAKEFDAKIVTNDFNLNKVAQLRGVEVLNINELANALKPVYLPGETMKVFILKEGKEFNQGIAYLDDGTMVVVDNARKMIGKTVDSSVTSVLQTTAGKMIFGRYEEKRADVGHHATRVKRLASEAGNGRAHRETGAHGSFALGIGADRKCQEPVDEVVQTLAPDFRLSCNLPMKVTAIIAAAGVGRRMKTDRPKQLLVLDDTPILIHTIRKFDACPASSTCDRCCAARVRRGDQATGCGCGIPQTGVRR